MTELLQASLQVSDGGVHDRARYRARVLAVRAAGRARSRPARRRSSRPRCVGGRDVGDVERRWSRRAAVTMPTATVMVDGGGVWHSLGLGTVPLTISVSFIVLVGWVRVAARRCTTSPATRAGCASILLPLVIIVALPVAVAARASARAGVPDQRGQVQRRLRRLTLHRSPRTRSTTRSAFANIEDGGTRSSRSRCAATSRASSRAATKRSIIEFDPERQTFVVEPSADMLSVFESRRSPDG